MDKKAIIYYFHDASGKRYKSVVVCDADKVSEIIAESKRRCTEIEDIEVVNAIIK